MLHTGLRERTCHELLKNGIVLKEAWWKRSLGVPRPSHRVKLGGRWRRRGTRRSGKGGRRRRRLGWWRRVRLDPQPLACDSRRFLVALHAVADVLRDAPNLRASSARHVGRTRELAKVVDPHEATHAGELPVQQSRKLRLRPWGRASLGERIRLAQHDRDTEFGLRERGPHRRGLKQDVKQGRRREGRQASPFRPLLSPPHSAPLLATHPRACPPPRVAFAEAPPSRWERPTTDTRPRTRRVER